MNPKGEWWSLVSNAKDESEGCVYYYHTGTKETTWSVPEGEFVIPLGILQVEM